MQNYEIIVIDDKAMLEKIGNTKSRVLEEFLRDNYEQLSFSEEELKQKKTGILSEPVFRLIGLTQPNLAKSYMNPFQSR